MRGENERARSRRRVARILALALAVPLPGCVERRLFIRSDPEGARVFLDGEPRGVTPCEVPFTYYGTREVVLRAEGRRVAREVVSLTPPWYQVTPLDFVTEILWPFTIEDVHEVSVTLSAEPRASEQDLAALRARAERMRAPDPPSASALPKDPAPRGPVPKNGEEERR